MRIGKVLRIRSSAFGRTLSRTLGAGASTDCFLREKSETSRDQGCGLPRQSALSALEQICWMGGVSSAGQVKPRFKTSF